MMSYKIVLLFRTAFMAHPIFVPNIGKFRNRSCVICNILDTNIVSSVKTLVAQTGSMMKYEKSSKSCDKLTSSRCAFLIEFLSIY